MQEIYDNLFQETISYSDRHMSPRNLYLIRQPGRSLMVDTSFRFERDWEILRGMVDSLGVSYKELDVSLPTTIRTIRGLCRRCRSWGQACT